MFAEQSLKLLLKSQKAIFEMDILVTWIAE